MKKTMVVVGGFVAAVFGGAFLWRRPETSGDVAGWMQAFGSIVAIGLAVWLQYLAKTETERQARRLATAFAGQVVMSFDAMQLSCRNNHQAGFNAARQALEDALKIDIPLADLDAGFIALVLTLRGLAATVPPPSEMDFNQLERLDGDARYGNQAFDIRRFMRDVGITPSEKNFSP